MVDWNKLDVSLALKLLCLASLIPRIHGQTVGMSSHMKILITQLLCLVTNIVDWSPFGWNDQLKEVWDLPTAERSFHGTGHFGYSLKIVYCRLVLSVVVLVRNFTAPLHLLFYILMLYSILMWKRPGRILSTCLIVAAFSSILTNLVATIAGVLLCWIRRRVRWRTSEFLVVQMISTGPSIYLWRLMRPYCSGPSKYRSIQDRAPMGSTEDNVNIVEQLTRTVEPLEGSVLSMYNVYEDSQNISSISNINDGFLGRTSLDVGPDVKESRSWPTLLRKYDLESEEMLIDNVGLSPVETFMKTLGLTWEDVANIRARTKKMVSTSPLEEDPENNAASSCSFASRKQKRRDLKVSVEPLLDEQEHRGSGYSLKICLCFGSSSEDEDLQDNSEPGSLTINKPEEPKNLQRSVSEDCPIVSFDLATMESSVTTMKSERRTHVHSLLRLKNLAVMPCFDFKALSYDKRGDVDVVIRTEKVLPDVLRPIVGSSTDHEEQLGVLDDVTESDSVDCTMKFRRDIQLRTIDEHSSLAEEHPEEKKLSLEVDGVEKAFDISGHEDGTKSDSNSETFEQQSNSCLNLEDFCNKINLILSKIKPPGFDRTTMIEDKLDKDSFTRNAEGHLKDIDKPLRSSLLVNADPQYVTQQLQFQNWTLLNNQLQSKLSGQMFIDRNVFSRIVESTFDSLHPPRDRDYGIKVGETDESANTVSEVELGTDSLVEESKIYNSTSRLEEKFEDVDEESSLSNWQNRYSTGSNEFLRYLMKDADIKSVSEECRNEQQTFLPVRESIRDSKKSLHQSRKLELEETREDKNRILSKIVDSRKCKLRKLKREKSQPVDPNDWGTVTLAQVACSSGYEVTGLKAPEIAASYKSNETANRVSKFQAETPKTLPVSSERSSLEVEERERSNDRRSTFNSRAFEIRKRSESIGERTAREMQALKAYNQKTLLKYKREMEAKKQKVPVVGQNENQKFASSLIKNNVDSLDVEKNVRKVKKGQQNTALKVNEEEVSSNVNQAVEEHPVSIPIDQSTNRAPPQQQTDPLNVLSEDTAQCFFKMDGAVTLERLDTYSGNKLRQEPGKMKVDVEVARRKQYSKHSKPRSDAADRDVSSASCKTFEGSQKGRDLDRISAKENIRDQRMPFLSHQEYEEPSTNDGIVLVNTIKSFTRGSQNNVSTSSSDSNVPEGSQPMVEILQRDEDIPRRIEESEEYRRLRHRDLCMNVREAIGNIEFTCSHRGLRITDESRIGQIDHSVQNNEQLAELQDIVCEDTVDLLRKAFSFNPEDNERGFRLGPAASEFYPIYDNTLVTIGEIIKAVALQGSQRREPVNEFASQPDAEVEILVAEEEILCGAYVPSGGLNGNFKTDRFIEVMMPNGESPSSIDQGFREAEEARHFGARPSLEQEESPPLVHIPRTADGFLNRTKSPNNNFNGIGIAEERTENIDCSILLGNDNRFLDAKKILVPSTKWPYDSHRLGTKDAVSIETTGQILQEVVHEFFFNLSRVVPSMRRAFLIDDSALRKSSTTSHGSVLEDVSVNGKSIQDLLKELIYQLPIGTMFQTQRSKSLRSSTAKSPKETKDRVNGKMIDFKVEPLKALHMTGITTGKFIGVMASTDTFSEVSSSHENSTITRSEQTFSTRPSVTDDLEEPVRRTVKKSTGSYEPAFAVDDEDVDSELEENEEDGELFSPGSGKPDAVPEIKNPPNSTLIEDVTLEEPFSPTKSELFRRQDFRYKMIISGLTEGVSPEIDLEKLLNSLFMQKGVQVDHKDIVVDQVSSSKTNHALDSNTSRNNAELGGSFIRREGNDEKRRNIIDDYSKAGCSKSLKKTRCDGYQSEIERPALEIDEVTRNEDPRADNRGNELEKQRNLKSTNDEVTENCISVKSLDISNKSEKVDEGVPKKNETTPNSREPRDSDSYRLIDSAFEVFTSSGYKKVSLVLTVQQGKDGETILEIGNDNAHEDPLNDRLKQSSKSKISDDKKMKSQLTRFEYRIQRHLSRRGYGLSSGYLMDFDSDGMMMVSHPSTPISVQRSIDATSMSKRNNIETIINTLKTSGGSSLSECSSFVPLETSENNFLDKDLEQRVYDDTKMNLKNCNAEKEDITCMTTYDFDESNRKIDERVTRSYLLDAEVDEEGDEEVSIDSEKQDAILRNKISEFLEESKSMSFDIVVNELKDLVTFYSEDVVEARSRVSQLIALPQFVLLESLISHLRFVSKVSTSTSSSQVPFDDQATTVTLTRSSTRFSDFRSNSEILQDKQDRFQEIKEILSQLTDAILESLSLYGGLDSKLKSEEEPSTASDSKNNLLIPTFEERRSFNEPQTSCHKSSAGLIFENKTGSSGFRKDAKVSLSGEIINTKENQSLLPTSSGFNVVSMILNDLVNGQGRWDDVEKEMEDNLNRNSQLESKIDSNSSNELLYRGQLSSWIADQYDSMESLGSKNTIEASNASESANSVEGHSFMEEFSRETLNDLESTSEVTNPQDEQPEGSKLKKQGEPSSA